jgi:hypothetical protein
MSSLFAQLLEQEEEGCIQQENANPLTMYRDTKRGPGAEQRFVFDPAISTHGAHHICS